MEITPMTYLVLIEEGPTSFGASVPDLPGCVAVARTRDEVERLIQESNEMPINGLKADGLPNPYPATRGTVVRADFGVACRPWRSARGTH